MKEALHDLLKVWVDNLGQPTHYKSDIDIDVKSILIHKNKTNKFLWVCKEVGTYLFPLHIGLNPIHATFWFEGKVEASNTVSPKCFLLSIVDEEHKEIRIEKVSYAVAYRLAHEQPAISTPEDLDDLLRYGQDNGYWGALSPPSKNEYRSWREWLALFQQYKNPVMTNVMKEALKALPEKAKHPLKALA